MGKKAVHLNVKGEQPSSDGGGAPFDSQTRKKRGYIQPIS